MGLLPNNDLGKTPPNPDTFYYVHKRTGELISKYPSREEREEYNCFIYQSDTKKWVRVAAVGYMFDVPEKMLPPALQLRFMIDD